MEQKQEEPVDAATLARWKRQGGKDDEKVALPHAANYWHVPLEMVQRAVDRGVVKSETDEHEQVWIRRSEFSRVKHWKLRQCQK